jgi:peptidoglycan/xylan/chitin deacetylase (PgdA/CDA1 family)
MERHQIEFGGHTATHPILTQLSPTDVEREVLVSKEKIEDQLGHTIDLFAYPYGQYNELVESITAQGYKGAVSTKTGIVEPSSNPLMLERIEILYLQHPLLFPMMLNRLFSPYLALRRFLRVSASKILNRAWD